jgi:hypothetical protein
VASTARRDEPEHDVVAHFEPTDPFTDLFHDAGTLVATDDREFEREVTGDEMLVGVAHARRCELHSHFAGTRVVEFDVLDAPWLVGFPQDCCLCLHVADSR